MNTTDMHIPSNKVRDIERYILNELEGMYPPGEVRMFVVMLFEAFMGWDRVRLLLHHEETINQSDLLKFHWAVEDLKKQRPIQYITGYSEFCGHRIGVKEGVLIPRPETEEMVQITTRLLNEQRKKESELHILDLCTGSGCIAIAMAKQFATAAVYGVDLSDIALSIAAKNACDCDVDVRFVQCDLLAEEPKIGEDTFDVIISNPPYICEKEKALMQPNVLDYEPGMALFVEDKDPLVFYRAIGKYAQKHLAPNGILMFEINEALGKEMLTLGKSYGFETELMKDFRGKDRFVCCKR